MLSDVHGQGTSASTETIPFGSKLTSVALLAIQGVVMVVHVDGIQSFGAQVTLEAGSFVPLGSSG